MVAEIDEVVWQYMQQDDPWVDGLPVHCRNHATVSDKPSESRAPIGPWYHPLERDLEEPPTWQLNYGDMPPNWKQQISTLLSLLRRCLPELDGELEQEVADALRKAGV